MSALGFKVNDMSSVSSSSVDRMSCIGSSIAPSSSPSVADDDMSCASVKVASSSGSCLLSEILSLPADGSLIESSDASSLKSTQTSSVAVERQPTININRSSSQAKSPVRFVRILKSPQSDPSNTLDNKKDLSQLKALDELMRPQRYDRTVQNDDKLRALDEFMMRPERSSSGQGYVQTGHFREERMVPGSNNEVCFSPLNPSFSEPSESYDLLLEGTISPQTSSADCFNFSNPDQTRELSSVPTSDQSDTSQHSYHPNGTMFNCLINMVNPSSRYEKLYEIGEGGYGTVYVAHDTHYKEDVILKEMELKRIKMEDVAEEIAILDKFPHDNIMKLLDNFSTFNFYYMVFEFQSNVSLFEYLRLTGKLSEDETVYILSQVLDAVEWLHDNLIVHGDIKDENMVITSTTRSIVLIDFGSARILQDSLEPIMFRGTRVYSPPEAVLGDIAFVQSLDVWTLGTLTYVLLNNKRPFDDDNEIVNACIPYPRSWSEGARDFVRRCLSKEYYDRPSVTMLKYHPWILKSSDLM